MWARATLLWAFLGMAFLVCLAGKALAELMSVYLPDGVPGYDTDAGVTVETRLHPEQMPVGVREGDLVLAPRLEEATGYTSNALAVSPQRGSWEIVTAPSLTITSDWSRDAFGAAMSLTDTRYLSLPGQDRTDFSLSAGGRLDIGDDNLTLGAAHVNAHEDRSQVDTIPSDRPVAFRIDDVRAAYTLSDGPWIVVPEVQAANYTYDPTTVAGVPTSQAYRDRLVVQAGVTVTYQLAPLRSLLLVVRAVGQDYTHTPSGQPSPNSTSYQLLAGIDYDDDSVWRWRMLAGGEARRFASPLYADQNTLIAEAGVGWQPSALTTVSAVLSRDTEDAAQEGVSGLVYSAARLTIDHEYLRDVLLRAYAGLQRADFFQGGHQLGLTAGFGVTWVLNRNARLLFTYDQAAVRGSSVPPQTVAGNDSRGVGLVTLRLGL
jgi:hypothetical protein